LAANSLVSQVVSDQTIVLPTVSRVADSLIKSVRSASSAKGAANTGPTPGPCGTSSSPEIDPEALTNINALAAQDRGYDGAGITVAYIAEGIDTTQPDFQRNSAYASSGSPTGSHVVTQYDFTGDAPGTPTPGGEAFLDASSIAAQGNSVYDLSTFVNAAHSLPTGCDIKIIGAAPGASVMGLKVFGTTDLTTQSNFIEAINYAVSHGVKVLNESFGANQLPDTNLDVTRMADDAAVANGVTVVVSSGDAGIGNTIGSPATDPNLISVGASTTFRAYNQFTYGGINDPAHTGSWIDNNISSISSAGFSTNPGNTVDLVAPGDLNWTLCSLNRALFTDCSDEESPSKPTAFTDSGGTSESAPLTSGAAADVIQAYASTHSGNLPSPALIKQILMSTATDIGAPAEEQGAGLLNINAAVNMAISLPSSSGSKTDGQIQISPNQVNAELAPHQTTTKTLSFTNTGSTPETVNLTSRALTDTVATTSGSFCMQPGTPSSGCPANTGSFPIWSGVIEVYQNVPFTVGSGVSRLQFRADYTYTGQTSLLHMALIDPNGAYAAYSIPQ
ncbi:MAG TPA: S8 family serine peptidase, partial [Acidimicrobiales bacterium]|nr:S8 family serine peptidase [Acidimicrobiales bacterium]